MNDGNIAQADPDFQASISFESTAPTLATLPGSAESTLRPAPSARYRQFRFAHVLSPPWGPLLLAGVGVIVFVVARLPVTDLNAANARAEAVGNGVGWTYWFSWFGGNVPARYSMLTAAASYLFGVRLIAVLSVLAIAALLPQLLSGAYRPVGASYLGVLAGLANLYSGRVAFCLGSALALAACTALRCRRTWLGGAFSLLGGLISGLPAAFVVLGLVGPVLSGRLRLARIWPFLLLTGLGLTIPPLLFGAPGPLAFDAWTLIRVLVILASALATRPPSPLRRTLIVAAGACAVLYLVPNGLGGNINRFACYVVPVALWALSVRRRRVIAVALLPAVLYSGWILGGDVHRALQPSARVAFDTPLMQELADQPGILNQRVEALDTSTHRPSADLADHFYLARGWESQSDAAANPIMYSGALTTAGYRAWLDSLAVAWVAVPVDINSSETSEAQFISTGHPPYLHQIWHNGQWTVFAVSNPRPLVQGPAILTSRSPAEMTIYAPHALTSVVRIRPSPYLRVLPLKLDGPSATITPLDDTSVLLTIPAAGSYRISSKFDLRGIQARFWTKNAAEDHARR